MNNDAKATRTTSTPLDAGVRSRIISTREAKENGTSFVGLPVYYKELLGLPHTVANPTHTYATIDAHHYATTSQRPMDPSLVAHLTRNASQERPVIIEGAPITAQVVTGATGAMKHFIDLDSVDESYLFGTGRSVFYAPVKPKVFHSVGYLASHYEKLGGESMVGSFVSLYREAHPGFKNVIEKGELEDFFKFVESQPMGFRSIMLEAPKSDEPPADFSVVPSLEGTVVDEPVVVYSNELLCRSLYLSPERARQLGYPSGKPVPFLAADVRPRVAALLKAAGRSLSYDFTWRKGVENSPLYTAEQYTMIRSWIRAEGDKVEPSADWVKRAREVFPAKKPTTMYGLSRPLITMAGNGDEERVVDALRKHKAEMVKIVRFNSKRVEPLKLPSLMYTKKTADAIFKELTGKGL